MLSLQKIVPEIGGIALREIEPREPGPGEISIRVGAAGICGTDMQIYNWAPRMARRMALPRVLGHEVSGTVEAVGSGVEVPAVGDRVSLESHIYCGRCRSCRLDRAHLCEETRYPGIDIDGAFAEYLTVPASIAWVNPPDLPHETAAMLEPFGIAVHACLAGAGVSGSTVLVNGCGPIGLMTVAVARALGALRIVACDIAPLRLRAAETMGADRAVDAGNEDPAAVAADMTGGAGVDVGIEFSGTEAGFNAVFQALAKGGDFRLVGAPPSAIPVDFTRWLLKCPAMQNIHGRLIWQTWQRATELLAAGAVDIEPVRSHTLPLSEAPRGFELIRDGEALKPVLVP
ncbi:MAG: alcohol dehydrogenase catalytic domain-containing protein [Defluviicoccus sp.]|nr:alcohol dehydrogenase catalytic domain-containing protein [Defluviicoccus sp.]MDE0276817.1 alcohol dehydrogenase catalytic domain-containing protein [Defluviicoccus sp.]